ncbi:DUF2357 domain-containing protein [Clostridium estertheticum]|nr:DUF2357 domain-containing protein [Clostridium estertheticum]WBL45300.1 DUF2357 domain-containing protein [Clostridium estertheticum]
MEMITKKVTLDIKENRFVKFILITIINNIDSFLRKKRINRLCLIEFNSSVWLLKLLERYAYI